MQQTALSHAPVQGADVYWEQSLGYSHAVIAALGALAVGTGLHFSVGYRVPLDPALALGFGALPVAASLIAGRFWRKKRVVQWLTGIPFAVASTTLVALLALVGGVAPQTWLQERAGIPSMWASWPFLMAMLLMLVNLVGSCGKRLWPISYANIVYLASHLGLATAVIGGAVSAATLERNVLVLFEGMPTSEAQDAHGHKVPLPFAARLNEFHMDTVPPTLVIARYDKTTEGGLDLEPGSTLIKPGTVETIDGYQVEVIEFHKRAMNNGDTYQPVQWKTGASAARVKVTDKSGKAFEGWVSSGSIASSASMVELGEGVALAMPDPRPKRFASTVEILLDGKERTLEIEVNKPAHVAGYDLYQLSYDSEAGPASQYSVIEVVEDHGLGIVYAGIFIMLAGCVLHLWNGVGGKN